MADVFMAGYWLGTFVEFLVFIAVYLLERWHKRNQRREQEERRCWDT